MAGVITVDSDLVPEFDIERNEWYDMFPVKAFVNKMNGKYQVKWDGYDDLTWEPVKELRAELGIALFRSFVNTYNKSNSNSKLQVSVDCGFCGLP